MEKTMSKKWFEDKEQFENSFEGWYNSLDNKWKHILSYISKNYHLQELFMFDWNDTDILDSSRLRIQFSTETIFSINLSTILMRILQVNGNDKFLLDGKSICNKRYIPFGLGKYLTVDELSLNSLKPLKYFKNLKHLNINNLFIIDSDSLFDFKNLESLFMFDTPIVNIHRLKELTNLKKLKISNPFHGVDKELWDSYHTKLESIIALKNLTDLELKGYWDFDKLGFLSELTNVISLEIHYPLKLNQLSFLKNLRNLSILRVYVLSDNQLSKYLKEISKLVPNLEILKIGIRNPEWLTQSEEFEFLFNVSGVELLGDMDLIDIRLFNIDNELHEN